jgi:penicillin-binding protein 2
MMPIGRSDAQPGRSAFQTGHGAGQQAAAEAIWPFSTFVVLVDCPNRELDRFRFRVAVAGIAVALAFAVLIARFSTCRSFSTTTTRRAPRTTASRWCRSFPTGGSSSTATGSVLARNYSAFTLEITPSKVDDLDTTIDGLARLIEILPKDRKRFRRLLEESKNFESLPIRTAAERGRSGALCRQPLSLSGRRGQGASVPSVSPREVAAHAIGYINRINKRDLEMIEESEQAATTRAPITSARPASSRNTNSSCTAKPATSRSRSMPVAGPSATCRVRHPVQGNNLTLTLDIKLQEMAEKAFGDRRGALVAIEPSTGGILALVSTPTFDPNLFVDGIRSDDWDCSTIRPTSRCSTGP